ncbi:hypothetical protein IV203_030217 [Nitzschia inconspicua]|uniref:Uncharacterized protein n=1 Tax=Nitzschia inconspicua TaxID=303405 RepID=A0A9K3LVN4_9STRA|nr:hypothetical protein IV203_030217 [Nitzschia inconspicua]
MSSDGDVSKISPMQYDNRQEKKTSIGHERERETDDDFQSHGYVAVHHRVATTTTSSSINNPSKDQNSQRTKVYSSSWASNMSPNLKRQIRMTENGDRPIATPGKFPRSATPNMSNLSSEKAGPEALFETRSNNNNRTTLNSQYSDDASLAHLDMEDFSTKNSFKGWLAGGLLDILNSAAGFTIATTGTILSPPLAMTKNVVLPAVLAIVVDTLDNIIPLRVQDWFRILSSSIYHLYSVLKSTEKGQQFRHQFTLVFQNLFEMWSSPESRQLAVDGVVAGIKLADALHTPEMQVFLEQVSLVGCRLVDAIGSGKTKQFIRNSGDLAWQGIELAVDPTTILAMAEVTAHFCHALEELDDSFHPTPRAIRNTQNRATYLRTHRMTDYRSDRIENIILSSLGIQEESLPESVDDRDAVDCDGVSMGSVPSNVAFLQETVSQVDSDNRLNETNCVNSTWAKSKDKVDTDLLREKILEKRRTPSRKAFIAADQNRWESSLSTVAAAKLQAGSDVMENASISHSKEKIDEADIGKMLRSGDNFSANELIDTFEGINAISQEETTAMQFYRIVDDLLEQKRRAKIHEKAKIIGNGFDADSGHTGVQQHNATVRRFGRKTKRIEHRSKDVREQYSNLRRVWKYPPILLYFCGCIFSFILLTWFGFGLFGFYKFYQGMQHQTTSPNDWSGSRSSHLESSPNEIVIRIVKEVIRANDDDVQTQRGGNDPKHHRSEDAFSENELSEMLQCLGAQ